jgi:hypothetical protein
LNGWKKKVNVLVTNHLLEPSNKTVNKQANSADGVYARPIKMSHVILVEYGKIKPLSLILYEVLLRWLELNKLMYAVFCKWQLLVVENLLCPNLK